MLMTPQNVEWLKLFTPKSTKCRISLKIQKSVRHQGQSCHLDFKLLGICNYLTRNLTARNFLNWFILCMFPIKVARMVLIEARGGGGGIPCPRHLVTALLMKGGKTCQVCLLSLGLKGSNYST